MKVLKCAGLYRQRRSIMSDFRYESVTADMTALQLEGTGIRLMFLWAKVTEN
jgi:hypothetical protein